MSNRYHLLQTDDTYLWAAAGVSITRDIGRSCAVIENGRAERERESSTDRVSV